MVPPSFDDTSLEEAERIDRVCSEFEACWRRGDEPAIEDFLGQVEPEARRPLLVELVAIEIELRRTRGETIDPGAWERRFPGVGPIAADILPSADEQFDAWLDARALTPAPTPPAEVAAATVSFLPGERFETRRRLGEGGFGTVWLAWDRQLRREVAVKCIAIDRCPDAAARKALRREAQLAAGLGHPGIVEILEVIDEDAGLLVVQEYLAGGDLASRVAPGGLPVPLVAEWMAAVAEAVAFAHRRDLVHRDLKPANILIDDAGRPRVADFGLALLEDDRLDPRIPRQRSGTIAYMSPEQVRGETHRLDGRSDTWSLGVMLYELLTGRRPFRGTREQVIGQIRAAAPRPPRELRPEIPAEIEAACLKCLARRKADRYSTAADLAADLRRCLPCSPGDPAGERAGIAPVPIVPRGLRAFGPADHAFFLGLLPGPRDREGLPHSVRFWKEAIEQPAAAPVAVVHGPSGCGKSSLVRAGVVPSLGPGVVPVVVDASANDTERRVLAALRLRLPALGAEPDLAAALAAVRSGQVSVPGVKVLVVIDQFEQWLDGWSPAAPAALVDGLRQCDGERLGALVIVRDDFWPAILRLFDRLELPLDPARNARPVDLFDVPHARRILGLLGAAEGRLSSDPGRWSDGERAFLDAAVAALEDRGRVMCVHLALLAVLLRDHVWTPATLEEAGGPRGLVRRFFGETFDPATVPLERRRLAAGARRVLAALLPPAGRLIRGTSVPRERLREVAGYADDPRGFDDLLGWLDGDLRVVTPTVSGEGADGEPAAAPDGERASGVGYQLTHDFLLGPLREWLDAGARATAGGRVRHLLAERAALWDSYPSDRLLPGPWEHLRMRWHSRPRERSPAENRHLRRAAVVHLRRGLSAALAGLFVLAVAWQQVRMGRGTALGARVRERVAALAIARPERWSQLVGELASPDLKAMAAEHLSHGFVAAPEDGGELPLRLARLTVNGDDGELPAIREALLSADPAAIAAASTTLLELRGPAALEPFWSVALAHDAADPPLGDGRADPRAFRAMLALAAVGPADPRWGDVAPVVAETLAHASAAEAVAWHALLEPVRRRLVPALVERFEAAPPGSDLRAATLESLLWAARDDGRALAAALLASDPQSFGRLIPVAAAVVADVLPELRRELARPDVSGDWHDPPGLAPWSPPDDVAAEIVAAEGEIHPAFAYCLAIPAERVLPMCEALGAGGYRPVHVHLLEHDVAHISVVWHRDGLPWAWGDHLDVEEALAEDARQAALGHAILAHELRGNGRCMVLWGPPQVWGRPLRRMEGPMARLEARVFVDRSAMTRWRVSYRDDPGVAVADGSGTGAGREGQPLLDGEFPDLLTANVAVARRLPTGPRRLRAVAEAVFHTDGRPTAVSASQVQGLRAWVDGKALTTFDLHADRGTDVPPLTLDLPAGRHTLEVEMWWNEFDARSRVELGVVAAECSAAPLDEMPDWLHEPLEPADAESMVTLHPAFDVMRIALGEPVSTSEVRAAIAKGFRPYRVKPVDLPRTVAIDLCRPRAVAGDVDAQSRRRVRAALALVELDASTDVWSDVVVPALTLRGQPGDPETLDATLATEMMFALAEYPLPRSLPWNRLAEADTVPADARHRLWLALGLAGLNLPPAAREAWSRRLDIPGSCARETDAAVHGALDWLTRAWGLGIAFPDSPHAAPRAPATGERPVRWRDARGEEYALFPSGRAMLGGTDPAAVSDGYGRREVRIERSFALATTCVTRAAYHRYLQSEKGEQALWKRTSAFPCSLAWIDAVRYLNWLSDQDGLERCYGFDDAGNVVIHPDSLDRDGYRLPTGDEWECAARAGTGTDWIHGSTPTRLGAFAWFDGNRGEASTRPVGLKLPNPAGLFDMQGNEREWLHDLRGGASAAAETVSPDTPRAIRGASLIDHWTAMRVQQGSSLAAGTPMACIRVARTLRSGVVPEAAGGGGGRASAGAASVTSRGPAFPSSGAASRPRCPGR